MKSKIYIFIIITGIFCALYATTDVFAYDRFIIVNKYDTSRYTFYVLNNASGYSTEKDTLNGGWYINGPDTYSISLYKGVFLSLDDCIEFAMTNNNVWDGTYDYNRRFNIPSWSTIMTYGVSLTFQDSNQTTVEDYLNPPVPDKTWWESMWDWLAEDMEKPLGFLWFTELIDSVFGDDSEGNISDNVTLGNPTIAPTPTPIPYTTVVIPKTDVTTGETYYETNYYYVNPSGTPIVTGSPPTNSTTNNTGGNGNQTYNPIDGKPYSIPKLDWMTSVDIDGNGYDGIDSIADGMSSIDDIGSEYTDGMSAVQDASGTLPTSWLLLIGIVAAIPLLAGIVSRFLGG